MPIITAPQTTHHHIDVFLAGGISGTEDWQSYAAAKLAAHGLVVANPRRPGVLDPSLEPEQITWERRHMIYADIIMFWFPGPGDHPIAMYELGYWVHDHITKNTILFVGCPDDYQQSTNIKVQMNLANGPIVMPTLDEMIQRTIDTHEYLRPNNF